MIDFARNYKKPSGRNFVFSGQMSILATQWNSTSTCTNVEWGNYSVVFVTSQLVWILSWFRHNWCLSPFLQIRQHEWHSHFTVKKEYSLRLKRLMSNFQQIMRQTPASNQRLATVWRITSKQSQRQSNGIWIALKEYNGHIDSLWTRWKDFDSWLLKFMQVYFWFPSQDYFA